MFKQVVLFKRRPGMTREDFKNYYENYHSKLHERVGDGEPLIPAAQRYVRRYITPERNPVTGEVIDSGFDCIMEIWWNSREDFESAMKHIGSPDILPHIIEDENQLFSTHSYPVFSVDEYDSALPKS